MSLTTLVPDTLDYLVALFNESPQLGAANPPVEVIDGPVPSAGPLPLALWVGLDDLLNAAQGDATLAGESTAESDDFARGQQEQLAIPCVAAAWSGDEQNGYSAVRASASAIVKAVETAVLTDTAAPAPLQNPTVTAFQWWQRPFNGLQVFVPFQIVYLAL